MSGDEIWSIIGKILALIGGFATLIKILEWVSSPRQKLTATVKAVPFELPEPKNYANKLSNVSSMWVIGVKNNGKKPCAGIKLVLPHAEIARINRLGASDEYRELLHGIVNLGSLDSSDWITIHAWSSGRVMDYELTEVRISHNDGVGTIRPRAMSSKFFHDLEEALREFRPMIFAIVVGGVIGFLLFHDSGKTPAVKTGDKQNEAANLIPSISFQPTNSIHQ